MSVPLPLLRKARTVFVLYLERFRAALLQVGVLSFCLLELKRSALTTG